MALIISGVTQCVLCGHIIARAADAVGFPAFLPKEHRLYPFSDAAFHTRCYETWAEKTPFEHLYFKYRVIWENRPKDLKTIDEIEAWGEKAFAEFYDREE
jgi:hypothetical protein